MLCAKASDRADRAPWMQRIGVSYSQTFARPHVTSTWQPPCGMDRCCRNTCAGGMEWTSVCGNASDYFEIWAFGYVSPAPRSLNQIR